MKTRVIIADDHPVVIQGIRDSLEKSGRFDVIAVFAEGKSLLQSSSLMEADLLLLDLNMPGTDGLQTLDRLKKRQLSLKIIVLTSYVSAQLADQCREMGAHGYLIKSEGLHRLLDNIDKTLHGRKVFPDFSSPEQQGEVNFSYFDEFLKKYKLTKREVEIIRMVCNDYNSKEIADKLYLSAFTVQTHRRNIVKKLGLDDSKISLYRFAIDNGVI